MKQARHNIFERTSYLMPLGFMVAMAGLLPVSPRPYVQETPCQFVAGPAGNGRATTAPRYIDTPIGMPAMHRQREWLVPIDTTMTT